MFIYEEEFRIFIAEISMNDSAKESTIKERVSEELFELNKPSGYYGITTINDLGKEEKFLLEYTQPAGGETAEEE